MYYLLQLLAVMHSIISDSVIPSKQKFPPPHIFGECANFTAVKRYDHSQTKDIIIFPLGLPWTSVSSRGSAWALLQFGQRGLLTASLSPPWQVILTNLVGIHQTMGMCTVDQHTNVACYLVDSQLQVQF